MSRLLIVVAALLAISGTAYASSCPKHMKNIDEALAKNPTLAAAELAEVKKLRADGETLHKAGKHADSMTALGKAEAILKIK
ncbi:MAG: hypothetical protein KIT20_09490 [Alphaproteobacteria bacterium]|nr:hypothetical protein [Alphaproteobacteria bacterium]